jgi:diguanylate cyclase (GGDEF)-like protein
MLGALAATAAWGLGGAGPAIAAFAVVLSAAATRAAATGANGTGANGAAHPRTAAGATPRTGPEGTPPRWCDVAAALDRARTAAAGTVPSATAMIVEIDRFRSIEEAHDRAVAESILSTAAARLSAEVGPSDIVARLEGPVFAIALIGRDEPSLEGALQIAARLQRALADPFPIDGIAVHLTASVGFALPDRVPEPGGGALLRAATLAAIEAQRNGPAAIRSYSDAMHRRIANRSRLAAEAGAALANGEIGAWFQPQVSARTGEVTGFETLARWQHPQRGLIPPSEFLPALEQAGLMPRLGEVMVRDALAALRHWDSVGLTVPRVGVNLSGCELADPRLVDRIAWELDRHDLAPSRLGIEVLETVVAGRADDIVLRNLTALARLGCVLDLDDFGTGHAAITNIRRFRIGRIKIDRTFVTRLDEDAEQERMVGAIITMAERLGLDTLAEGVETPGERDRLAALGCGHLQGFAIARPMPRDEADLWLRAQQDGRAATLPFRRASR